ncbi:MAG TPA: PQQ-binding-like beta-propeller repeat protein [Pirellulales bacterium]|nr:PQQ-binding-like beta-propeller repeat protein [Pirellulales bacterium]
MKPLDTRLVRQHAAPIRHRPLGLLLAAIVCAAWPAQPAAAGDWPQILGPHRNGQADEEHLLTAWPAGGPAVAWQCEVGSGFAGVAVEKSSAVVFYRRATELVAEARQVATGEPLWKVTFPTRYASTISADDGPRCVPVISAGLVYLLGPGGELQCVTLDTGKRVWFRNLYQDFKAPEGYFGAGSSPLVEGGKLLVNVGGKGAGLVALALADGKTQWQATDELASYSSPIAATIDGVRHVIFVTRLSVVSVDAETGAVRFRFPFGARGPTVNAANPLILGDHLFVSASYGVGAVWAEITRSGAREIWAREDVMSSQYTTCVASDGLLYGIDGRQDVGVARMRCFDPRGPKVLWTREGFGTGNLILADGKLLAMKTDGELLLLDPTPRAFSRLASAKVFDDTVQALPALADGRLLVRDTKTLKCLTVGGAAGARPSP